MPLMVAAEPGRSKFYPIVDRSDRENERHRKNNGSPGQSRPMRARDGLLMSKINQRPGQQRDEENPGNFRQAETTCPKPQCGDRAKFILSLFPRPIELHKSSNGEQE